MASTRKQGAYYLRKSIEHFKFLGYRVEKLEVAIPFFFKGNHVFSRKDLLGADLAVWRGSAFYLVQVKSGSKRDISTMRGEAVRQFAEWDVPLPKLIVLWKPKEKPIIEAVDKGTCTPVDVV